MSLRRQFSIFLCSLLALSLIPNLRAQSLSGGVGGKGMGGSNYGNGRNNGNNNKNNNNTDKPGDGDSVKKWKSESADDAKKDGRPICLYIYDPSNKTNARAKLLEGPSGLESADVKEKLKQFASLKVVTPGGAKGWPEAWMENAKTGASLIIITSDFKQSTAFDRDMPKDNIRPDTIVAAMDGALKYEAALKANAPKANAANAANPPANAANPNANRDMKKS